MDKICSFFGHRNVEESQELTALARAEIVKAINFGCRTFYFGGFGDWDSLCHKIVTEMKEEYPRLNIKRLFCVTQERYIRKRARYYNLDDYEDFIYLAPSFEGWYKSIYFRNCAMIDQSDYVIFYAEERADSGAYKAFKHAKKQKDKIIKNLYNQFKPTQAP